MKVYNLRCEHEHRFEGWFSSGEDFCRQVEKDLLECPVCASRAVTRLPSAPRLNLSGAQASAEPAVQNPAPAHAPSPAQVQAQAQVLAAIRHIIANTENVGEQFAEEARRIHYKEAPDRAIRGTASVEECEALADEGIDVAVLPVPDVLKQPVH